MKKLLFAIAGLCLTASPVRAQDAGMPAAVPQPVAAASAVSSKNLPDATRFDRRMQAKYAKKIAEINEDYEEDVEEINRSSMPQELKELRLQQAAQMRDLELKQAGEKAELKQAHRDALNAMPAYRNKSYKKHKKNKN